MTRQEAESLLITKVLPLVQKLAWKCASKRHLSFDDLVQAGVMAAWARLPEYDPSRAALDTFLIPRIKFAFIDLARRQGSSMGWSSRYKDLLPTYSLDSLMSREDDGTNDVQPFEIADHRQSDSLDEIDSFDNLINDLHPREKRALRLFYRDGWSQVQIARDMRYSPSRVSQVLTEALAKLRERWRQAA